VPPAVKLTSAAPPLPPLLPAAAVSELAPPAAPLTAGAAALGAAAGCLSLLVCGRLTTRWRRARRTDLYLRTIEDASSAAAPGAGGWTDMASL